MTAKVSSPYFNTNYIKFDEKSSVDEKRLFDVRNYDGEDDDGVDLDLDQVNVVNIRDNPGQQIENDDDQKRDSSREAEDVVTELDPKEIERRQREANEETTRSEDLRLFLQEMHQKCQPVDPPLNSNVAPKSPGSVQRLFTMNSQNNSDFSPYKEITDPSQENEWQTLATETATMGPPDGGWAWLVVLASFFCMVTIDGTCFNYGLIVPDMIESFLEPQLMPYIWPGSLIAGFYMSIGPIASALSNQFDFRPVAMAGAIISGVAIFLSSFMNNLFAFILFFGIFGGIGFGLIYLPAIAIVGHWFHEKRPIAVGLALCGSGCGTLVYGQLIPLLIGIFTWKGSIILIAGVCIQAVALIALFRPMEVHIRLQQLNLIKSRIRMIYHEEHERKRLEYEQKLEDDKRRKKEEKEQLRQQNRMKNKRIVIYRGSIMQKIIEEKKRQRTVSMGSLDGMVITRDNELIQVAKSSIDLYEKPILSMNAINRITESVVKRLENKINKHGPNGVVIMNCTTDSKTGAMGTNSNISNSQIKNSLPQLVQEYINSQLSLQMTNSQSYALNNNNNPSTGLHQQSLQGTLCASGREFLVSSSLNSPCTNHESESTSNQSDSSSKTSITQGLILQEDAKAVIQASLRKEITRPFRQKELFFTGSMRQLFNVPNDRSNRSARSSIITIENTKRSQTSLNMINACNSSMNESGNQSILEGIEMIQMGMEGDVYSNQYMNDPNQPDYTTQIENNDGPFRTFMKDLLDVNLLTSPTFILMVISSMTAMLGIFVPFFFLPCYLTSQHLDLSIAGHLISYIGVANTVGRGLATIYIEKAWSSNYVWADCLWINNIALILAGAAACSVPFLLNYHSTLICVLCLYGLCVAAFVSLKSILVVELLGLNRLTNAFGFLLIFQGLATICGPPAAALICDMAHLRYEFAFYFSGGVIILSGVLCFPLRIVAGFERQYLEQRYGQIRIDEDNSVVGSYVDLNEDNAKVVNETSVNYENNIFSNKEEKTDITTQDTPKIESYDKTDDPILEPVVEEEEEDLHSDNHLDEEELFKVKVVD